MTQLLPVQEAALAAARHKAGFLYAMDMGLGKTLVALTEFQELLAAGKVSRLVVVAPNSFKGGWAAEIAKHGLPFSVHVYEALRHGWAETWLDGGFRVPPVLLVNYEALRLKKVGQLIADYTQDRAVMLVLDESIAIKNPSAQVTKALHKLKWRFPFVRCLTGKPITQGVHDLWAQLFMLGGTHGMTYHAFRNRFCKMGGWENRQVVGVRDPEILRGRISPFLFEATKKEWLPTLPEKAYTIRTYELNRKLLDHYLEMEREFMTWLEENGQEVMAEIALTKYLKLSQIQCGFIHANNGAPEWLVDNEHNPRLQLLLEILDGIDGKVCIVYRHKFVGEQLERALRPLTPALIAGGMAPEQIEAEKKYFNTLPHCRAMLLQVDSARYGHTLIGTETDPCHTMIFYESTYSLSTRSQIEDRIHRIGQNNACLYIDFVGTDTDWRLIRALQKKESVYQALFGEHRRAA